VSDPGLEARVAALEARVESLEAGRSGRRRLPIVVKEEGVCGVDPRRDSGTCLDGSLYRRQQGCLGVACKKEASNYWATQRVRLGRAKDKG
jgi:hypothetical protein